MCANTVSAETPKINVFVVSFKMFFCMLFVIITQHELKFRIIKKHDFVCLYTCEWGRGGIFLF